jgi:hypothetical protein
MINMTITVNQQLDECGGEFLDEREFEITFETSKGGEYVWCVIDGMEHCRIKKADLLAALGVMATH